MTWGSDALEHFLDDVGARNMVDERTLKLILGRCVGIECCRTGGSECSVRTTISGRFKLTDDHL